MSPASDRQYFASALGWVALAADALILVQFVANSQGQGLIYPWSPSSQWQDFWAFRWLLSVVLLFGLFGAGVGLLNVGRSIRARRLGLATFGLAFMLAAIVLYSIWAYRQVTVGLSFPDYSGFLVLFGALIGAAIASIGAISKESLRFASYGFGVIDAIFLFGLIFKYIFQGEAFDLAIFLGEAIVLILGILLFLSLFFGSEEGMEIKAT